jgi:uncharacterized protein (TIGR02145 family)
MKKIFLIITVLTFFYSCSTSSDENGNSTTTAVPVTPSNLTGTVASSTQINLSWTDNSTNETGFKIERKTGSGTYAVVGTTATDVTTFNNTGLTQSTAYTYRVYSYNSGGNSINYSNELIITSQSVIQNTTLGTQTWQTNNLDVSTYRDGTPIPQVTNGSQWANLTTGAWCYYNNDPANGAIYGKLYNAYAVAGIHDNDPSTPNKILAPTGWHIPSDNEWVILTNYLDPNANGGFTIPNNAGGAMKVIGTTYWLSPNVGATNNSNFSALPGGKRHYSGGGFSYILSDGYWWTSSQTSTYGVFYKMNYNNANSLSQQSYMAHGMSVRCVRD